MDKFRRSCPQQRLSSCRHASLNDAHERCIRPLLFKNVTCVLLSLTLLITVLSLYTCQSKLFSAPLISQSKFLFLGDDLAFFSCIRTSHLSQEAYFA